MSFSEIAPAKINLYLRVVGRRADGYHLLHSLVAFADVGDRLTVQPARDLTLTLSGPFAGDLAAEADNLVLRAARALAAAAGVLATGNLVLEKNLPVASGIGGGSADAAAALRLLCRYWKIDPLHESLPGIAQSLGADVPVCLLGEPSVMSGIGERLSPAPSLPDVGLVLINPGIKVATPSVFRARTGPFAESAVLPLAGWRDAASLAAAMAAMSNDLEAPAICLAPMIGTVLEELRAAPGVLLARMSGSGATCFGLFASRDQAVRQADRFRRPGRWVWAGGFLPSSRF